MLLPGRKVAKGAIETDGAFITKLELDDSVKCELFVIPGLVNAHGHTAMTLVRGLGGGLELKRWLEDAIFPVEARMTPAHIKSGVALGAMEMLRGGTTLVADMYDFPDSGEEAFLASGIKANTCRVGLSFVPGRLKECVDFAADKAVEESSCGRIVRDLCIHSEYLTSPEFCKSLSSANRDLKRPVHLHVSETSFEHEQCIQRHGMTPMKYLDSVGLLDYGAYAAHCVYCTDDDFRIMKEKNVTLVHNPTSNLKLGSGIARIKRALEIGVNVALGTDGCASNDDLDMFEEMRLAALLASGVSHDPTALSAWDVFEMATMNGARALGRCDTGVLEVGKKADFAVLDLNSIHFKPALDAVNMLVYSAHSTDVLKTVVDGKVVYDRSSFSVPESLESDFAIAVSQIGLKGVR
jgi:5-methylthioadenosine/S-adenosylhomocysteine deaminase